MARFPIADVTEEVQRYCNEVLGSAAEFITPEWAARNLMIAYNRVMAVAPNDWQDGDTLANELFTFEHQRTANEAVGAEPKKALPTTLLELRGFTVQNARAQLRLMHDIQEFGRAKALMFMPVATVLHLIVIRQGDNVHYWYNPSVNVYGSISFVKKAVDPSADGYFLCSERALPLVVACAAARGKWGNQKPADAQALNTQYMNDLGFAFQLERRKAISDPYTSEAAERRMGA